MKSFSTINVKNIITLSLCWSQTIKTTMESSQQISIINICQESQILLKLLIFCVDKIQMESFALRSLIQNFQSKIITIQFCWIYLVPYDLFILKHISFTILFTFTMRTIRHKNFKPQRLDIAYQERIKSSNECARGNNYLREASSSITISNKEYCERRERLTKAINRDLDSRDRQFLLVFEAVFNTSKYQHEKEGLSPQMKLTEKFREPEYLALKKAIFDYVSEVCQNISSISFKFLNNGDLGENQAKAFASKTILANIQSVFTDIKAKFCSFLPVEEINEIMGELTLSIDKYISELFVELANHYPQAPPVGATARMKEVIVGVNRSQDQNNDLIFANKISIERYRNAKDPEELTGFVMEVINKAILITSETIGEDQTIAQKYHNFTQSLFAFANFKKSKEIISSIKDSHKKKEKELFHYMFENDIKALESTFLQQISQAKQDWRQQARKEHKYGIAQKIPTYVKPFSNADIKQCNFAVSNSSILRVMTKWVEYLEEIFQKPQLEIEQRLYDFKDYKNQLKQLSQGQRLRTIDNLSRQYTTVKEKLKDIVQNNTIFQSYILSEPQKGSTYLKRFTQVRAASAQMNSITIEFTRKYLCILIFHLIKASQERNLVVFRIGDLLRSKLQCNQKTFINVINTLSLLDESRIIEGKFKLVRVKNKLNMRDNNVLINYMFMGKVQCQLQLSIQKMDKKDQNYYAFCHFLYELTRGKLGVLTECATIVCQHDPIVSASKETYYRPKFYQFLQKQKVVNHKINEKNQNIYLCSKCGRLKIMENIHLFNNQYQSCNECIIKLQSQQINLSSTNQNQVFKEYILAKLNQGTLKRMRNYAQIKNGQYIISVKNGKVGPRLHMHIAIKPKQQTKLFLVELNKNVLENFDKAGFDFSIIDYFDIQAKRKKEIEMSELMFAFLNTIDENSFEVVGLQKALFKKLSKFLKTFEQLRQEKRLIKAIKFKNQIIDIQRDESKFQILDKVVKAYHSENVDQGLLYKKYKTLQWSHLNHIKLIRLNEKEVPAILKFTNAKSIHLQDYSIQELLFDSHTRLQKLYLAGLSLKNINLAANVNLTQIRIYRSKNKLESFDLSRNINLRFIQLVRVPLDKIEIFNDNLNQINLKQSKLNAINFRKAEGLTNLCIFSNLLQQIDLSQVKNLKQLNLSLNQLQHINLKRNIGLTNLQLFQNQLKQLDLSYNINLTHINISQNKLSTINLKNLKSLKVVQLHQNQLQEVDLGQATGLQYLGLGHNKLQKIDFRNNLRLRQLFLNSNQLEKVDLSSMFSLKDLQMQRNKMKQFYCVYFTQMGMKMKIGNQMSEECNVVFINPAETQYNCEAIIEQFKKKYAKNAVKNMFNCKFSFSFRPQICQDKQQIN